MFNRKLTPPIANQTTTRFKTRARLIKSLLLLPVLVGIGLATVYLFGSSNAFANGRNLVSLLAGKVPAVFRRVSSSAPPSKNLGSQDTGGTIQGVTRVGANGIPRTTADIMSAQSKEPAGKVRPIKPERELEEREERPNNPNAKPVASFPESSSRASLKAEKALVTPKIHTTGLSWDGPSLTDTGAFPPDTMGAAGPTQYVAFVNGRIRTFTKAGIADSVIDADPDVFFSSVMTPVSGSVVLNFTSDPNVRYDRFTARWFLTIIDVPCTNVTCTTTAANRVLIAVSDAASAGVISNTTVWTFFQFQGDLGTNFLDYPSLGIDVNALYIGGNMFSSTGTFVSTNGYVVRKSTILGTGPITVTSFANLVISSGPFSPRGVDNFDPGATEGYFVGVDNAMFSTIMFRRVSNPGSATPTISADISVVVPTTTFPNRVEHAGNTGGTNGNLDALDDRLYAAMVRNGRLWTAHNFRVSSAGVASTAAASRNAVRWYEFQNLTTTPTLVQSGTVFDNAATRAAARQYIIPSVAVNGQGHAVLGFTMAGTPIGATPAFVGRLSGDTLGTMDGPPTQAAVSFGTTTANYNPPADPGGATGRRWGDYSFTVVDPLDDMTIWTIQEYNQASNLYSVRIAKLLAPPPATPTCSGSPITFTGPTGNVVINATSSGGSGFYDPGTNLPSPALPFNHISASMTNGTVNSITYNSPTQVTLNITANTTGSQNVTITNPDGQSVTANGCINVSNAAVADLGITKTDGVLTATPGGSVTYSITASNATATPATGATVADTFPAALTCAWTCTGAGGGSCTSSGSGNINDSVNLPAGASVTYTASCSINASATGTLSNTATVSLAGDPNASNNSATDSDTLTPQADLSITKTDGVTTAVPGQSVTYTVTASNAGPSNAPGSTVVDTLPASLTGTWTCVGAGGGTCTASGSGNISDTVNLPAGGSVTYTVTATIAANATGTLSNTATVATSGGVTDPTPGNNSATDSDTLTPQADLSITKTDGVTTAVPGQSVTYTVTASNAGPSNAPGSTVVDTLPASLTGTWTCVGAGGGTCTASGSGNISDTVNLPAGGSVTYTVTATIAANATGTLSNTATVATSGGVTDPTPGNNSATDSDTLTPQADLSITKTDGVTTAVPGQSVTYTVTASNAGPSNAPGTTVVDTLPASLTGTWTCVGAGGGTCTASGSGNISDTVNLPAGGSVTYTVTATIAANATGTLSNTATVATSGGVTDPTPGNNSATDSDTLTPQANLAITKTNGTTQVTAGGSTTYTISASNAGPSNAPGSTLADVLPAALTCTWTCVGAGGGTCTASGAGNISDTVNLPAGGAVTYTVSCSVSAAASGSVSNTVTVATSAGVTDTAPGNNNATDTDIVVSSFTPVLSETLLNPLGASGPGDVVNGGFSIPNSTTQPQTGSVTINLQSGLVGIPGSCVANFGTCTVNATTVTWSGTIPAATPFRETAAEATAASVLNVTYRAQIGNNVTFGAMLCAPGTATFGSATATATACLMVNIQQAGPGLLPDALNTMSDQKTGSVLIYPIYSSSASNASTQNTRIAITNTHMSRPAYVHLFFVDGSSCSIADSYICLTPNQTASLLASDVDPGTTGYLIAVAVNNAGCPTNFNYLIGDEYVKLAGGHQSNLGADSIAALAGGLPACDAQANSAVLAFDNVSYNALPRVLASSSILSRGDGNDTYVVINRIGGNLSTAASTIGVLFGILYDDAESAFSFQLSAAACQSAGSITNDRPRTVPRFETVVASGHTGRFKVWGGSDIGIIGAQINRNSNAGTNAGAFNHGHNLHRLTYTMTSVVTIPVFPPSC